MYKLDVVYQLKFKSNLFYATFLFLSQNSLNSQFFCLCLCHFSLSPSFCLFSLCHSLFISRACVCVWGGIFHVSAFLFTCRNVEETEVNVYLSPLITSLYILKPCLSLNLELIHWPDWLAH